MPKLAMRMILLYSANIYEVEMEMKDFYYFGSRHLSRSFQVNSIGLDEEEGSLKDHKNLIQSNYDGINFKSYLNKYQEKILQIH